jgi:hypothetical protein
MKYPTTNITYSGLSDNGGLTVTVLDENKNKWTIWKKDYNDKSKDSEAYSALSNYKIGDTFGISYGEQPEQFVNDQGKTINFTKRTIYNIMPPVSNPTVPTSSAKTSNTAPSSASTAQSDDQYWDKKAYKQCLWGYWLSKSPELQVVRDWKEMVWDVFKEIEEDADKRFSGFSGTKVPVSQLNDQYDERKQAGFDDGSPLPGELPIINRDEEFDPTDFAEDIPFK